MKKLGCAKCGGTKKMKLGGSAVAKAPVNMYGIPQENMGTSGQMGFGRKGGSVKKMQVGGTSTVPKKPIVKKTVAPKKTTIPRKVIDSPVPMTGPDRPIQKPMMAKKGGMVKKPLVKAQAGRTVKSKTPFQQYMKTPGAVASDTIAKRDDINTLKKAPNKPGLDAAFRKTYGDDYVGRQSPGIYSKSAKEADAYDRSMGPSRKMGGATKKPLMKAQMGKTTDSTKYKPEPVYMSNKAKKERELEMAKQKAEDYYKKNPGTRPTSYTDTTTISKPKRKGIFKSGGAVKSKKK